MRILVLICAALSLVSVAVSALEGDNPPNQWPSLVASVSNWGQNSVALVLNATNLQPIQTSPFDPDVLANVKCVYNAKTATVSFVQQPPIGFFSFNYSIMNMPLNALNTSAPWVPIKNPYSGVEFNNFADYGNGLFFAEVFTMTTAARSLQQIDLATGDIVNSWPLKKLKFNFTPPSTDGFYVNGFYMRIAPDLLGSMAYFIAGNFNNQADAVIFKHIQGVSILTGAVTPLLTIQNPSPLPSDLSLKDFAVVGGVMWTISAATLVRFDLKTGVMTTPLVNMTCDPSTPNLMAANVAYHAQKAMVYVLMGQQNDNVTCSLRIEGLDTAQPRVVTGQLPADLRWNEVDCLSVIA